MMTEIDPRFDVQIVDGCLIITAEFWQENSLKEAYDFMMAHRIPIENDSFEYDMFENAKDGLEKMPVFQLENVKLEFDPTRMLFRLTPPSNMSVGELKRHMLRAGGPLPMTISKLDPIRRVPHRKCTFCGKFQATTFDESHERDCIWASIWPLLVDGISKAKGHH